MPTPEEKKVADKVISDKAEADEKARLKGLTLEQLQEENSTLRFENAERRVASNKATKAETDRLAAQKLIDDKVAVEKGEFKELYEKLKGEQEGSAGKVTAMEATLTKMLDAETANIPEEFRVLIPIGSVTAALEWIATAKSTKLFGKKAGVDVREPGEHNDKSITRQDFENLSPTARQKHVQDGGLIHD